MYSSHLAEHQPVHFNRLHYMVRNDDAD